jgi:hypothetical protein
MASETEGKGTGLGLFDGVVLVGVGVVGVLVAFWLLHFVAGLLWDAVKLVVLVALVVGVLWWLLGRSKS